MRAEDIELQPKQLEFVNSLEDLVIFGGGAGGGKTFAALMDNLQGIHDPDYTSVFFRTTVTEIEKGLWNEAKKIYHDILFDDNGKPRGKSHVNERSKQITFPSGSKTWFGYLEYDKHADSWYGQELTKIYFEEFQFRSWYQFDVLSSRNRSMAKVHKGIRCTLNPDPNHFVYKFVERFLDEDKYPIKDLSGKTAYYIVFDDVVHTSWDREDLESKFPPLPNGNKIGALSYTYIPATIDDNQKLMEVDPNYINKLASKSAIKRKQLLEGCWQSTDSQGMYFKRDWLQEATRVPGGCKWARGYDLAASEPQAGSNPDYTAGIRMGKSTDGIFYITGDAIDEFKDPDTETYGRFRKRSGERDQLILKQALSDGKECDLVLPEDAGAAGKDAFIEKAKFFIKHGIKVRKDNATKNANKLVKFEPFSIAAEHGLVYIVRSTFNDETYEALMAELEQFDGVTKSGRKRKDDWVDAMATAFNHLAKEVAIPSFTIPDFGMKNPFNL